jgi:hypothetical protein
MIPLQSLPPDACIDDPAANIEPVEVDLRSRAFSMASYGITRIKEWATRGDAKQRALRHDLVTLCMCPQFLPCKRPSAAWCARQHGVSRQYASRLQQEFTRAFGDHLQFRGQRFLDRARQLCTRRGRGRRGHRGRSPARSQAFSPPRPAAVPQARLC